MKICYIARDDGACAYYRLHLPMSTIRKHTDHETYKIEKGDSAEHIYTGLDGCDVLVVARPVEEQMLSLIEQCKDMGKAVVIDYDDDLWNVSPLSEHYREWGTKEITIDMGSGPVRLWEDGRNIDIKKNVEKMQWVQRCCEAADLISVTQPVLEGVYSRFGKTVSLPNCVEPMYWNKLDLRRANKDEVRLYWSGGWSHYEDFAILNDVLPVIMDKYPQVTMTVMGTDFKGITKKLPQDRYNYHYWVPTPAYPYKTAILDQDISLIPLAQNQFNRCKSNIKWVEQAFLGNPSVTSAVTPYIEHYNGRNGVFVGNTAKDWIEGISYLIENPMVRWQMGTEAKRFALANFDINKTYQLWIDAYEGLLNGY